MTAFVKDMRKPWLLDGFCGGGGGARGYLKHFRVAGVEILGKFRRQYPGQRFYQGDAVEFIYKHGHKFDAIHESPPCTGYTAGTRAIRKQGGGHRYTYLIGPTREALLTLPPEIPWVIENVGGARAHLVDPITLCGSQFDMTAVDTDGELLRLERHRLFESNFSLTQPGPCRHDRSIRVGGVYGAARTDKWEAQHVRHGGYNPPRSVQEDLIGVEHGVMTRKALKGCIPPVYAEWIARQMLEAIR